MRIRNNKIANNKLFASKYLWRNYPLCLDTNTILELGMGKGTMLTNMARQNPNKRFVGVEKFATIAAQAIQKAENLKLNNFFVVYADIVNLLTLFEGQVNKIHLTFPDPWPKKRHTKRRLTSIFFLRIYEKILTDNGVIQLKTDNDKFFEYSIQSFLDANWIIKEKTNNLAESKFFNPLFMTDYEKKWVKLQKNINYLEVCKKL